MVGNDVVDLGDAESHTRHPGFDARVFTRLERARIERASDPHRLRQVLWAAKESSYKAAKHMDAEVVFSPVRFETELDPSLAGRVVHPGGTLHVRVHVSGDCVHAIATSVPEAQGRVLYGAAPLAGLPPGQAARRLAVDTLAVHFGLEGKDLDVARRGRIPLLQLRGAPAPALLSLSHHGRFAAWAALPARTSSIESPPRDSSGVHTLSTVHDIHRESTH